jgi:Biotin synthase-related enzyme
MEYTELKIRLMQQGAVFTNNARQKMHKGRYGHFTFNDYATTGGVVLELDGRIYVNVPVRYRDTPFSVDLQREQFVIKMDETVLAISVKIIPAPEFALNNFRLRGERNIPIRDLVMTHADRLRISPVHGCFFHCQFCTCNVQKYSELPCDILNQAVQVAIKDSFNQPRHILISGGTPMPDEDSYEYMNKIYSFFPKNYPKFEFDVMLSPRGLHVEENNEEGYANFLKYLKNECGFSTISVNLELYNEQLRKQYIPDKAKIGKESYYTFIRTAVQIFGVKQVRSSLIVGLEKEEDTLKAVEKISSLGCIPVLSAFVPGSGTSMEREPKPEVEFLLDCVYEAAQIVEQYGMELGPLCRPCTHNSITKEEGSI